jgi:hypothetical protein
VNRPDRTAEDHGARVDVGVHSQREFSVRFSSSRLWMLGTSCAPAAQRPCRHVDDLSRKATQAGTGRGRRERAHAVSAGCPPRPPARSTVPAGMSTAVHRVVHGLCPDGPDPADRLCPQGCPHVVYEACPIVFATPARATLATRRYAPSLGARRGDPAASRRGRPMPARRLAVRDPAGRSLIARRDRGRATAAEREGEPDASSCPLSPAPARGARVGQPNPAGRPTDAHVRGVRSPDRAPSRTSPAYTP